MRRVILAAASAALAAFLTAPAFAQTPNPELPNPEFQAAAIRVLINQRNAAQNEAAQAEASVDLLNKKMADLQKQIDDFKSKDKPQPSPTPAPSRPSGE